MGDYSLCPTFVLGMRNGALAIRRVIQPTPDATKAARPEYPENVVVNLLLAKVIFRGDEDVQARFDASSMEGRRIQFG
jgi:hypothetical protein